MYLNEIDFLCLWEGLKQHRYLVLTQQIQKCGHLNFASEIGMNEVIRIGLDFQIQHSLASRISLLFSMFFSMEQNYNVHPFKVCLSVLYSFLQGTIKKRGFCLIWPEISHRFLHVKGIDLIRDFGQWAGIQYCNEIAKLAAYASHPAMLGPFFKVDLMQRVSTNLIFGLMVQR